MGKTSQYIKYDPVTLIHEYKQRVRERFASLSPALTDADINDICRYQFILLARTMEGGSGKAVRIKYLGIFDTYRSRAVSIVNKARRLYQEGKIKQEDLLAVEEVAENVMKEPKYGENTYK